MPAKIIVKPSGPKTKEWVERSKSSMAKAVSHQFPDLVISKATGAYVTDVDGNVYIDFSAQRVNVGHKHPQVMAAVKQQIDTGGCELGTESRVILAERLREIAPGRLKDGCVGFARGGTPAAEYSILLARSYTKRPTIFSFQGSYHGNTLGALSLTMSVSQRRKGRAPLMSDVAYAPFPYCYRCVYGKEYPNCGFLCIDYIRYVLDTVAPPEDTAAFFIEPIQVHGGVVVPPDEYFGKIRRICDEYQILLVDDEVVTGFGRTGKMFGIENWNVEPDCIFMGKPIASGMDLGAVICKKEVMKFYDGHMVNPVSCAAAIANIEVILDEKLIENALKVGKYMLKRLKEMQEQHDIVGDVRGKGLLIGIELVRKGRKPATKIAKEVHIRSYRNGLLTLLGGTYEQVLRLTPPLNITKEQVDEALGILEKTFSDLNL